MRKIITIICMFLCGASIAASRNDNARRASNYVDPETYAYMYPYLNNQMRTDLNPGTTVSMVNNPVDVFVRTKQMGEQRRVVPRTQKKSNTAARAATTAPVSGAAAPASQTTRRVVARPQSSNSPTSNPRTSSRASRGDDNSSSARVATNTNTNATYSEPIPAARCMADYINCMNGYCERENTAYNRCYCSAKLAQIDSKYQSRINNLIIQILKIQGDSEWTEEEMNEYWMSIIGIHTGENVWTNLDDALDIDWASAESRVRGQQAFVTGHEYCAQHLRGCAYMAGNMRDAYRSQISRDCNAYEDSLIRLKNAAESVIEHYSE